MPLPPLRIISPAVPPAEVAGRTTRDLGGWGGGGIPDLEMLPTVNSRADGSDRVDRSPGVSLAKYQLFGYLTGFGCRITRYH